MRDLELHLCKKSSFGFGWDISSQCEIQPVCTGRTVLTLPCPAMKSLHWHSILRRLLGFVTFLNFSFSLCSLETITHPCMGPLCQGFSLEILIWNVDLLLEMWCNPGILPLQNFFVPKPIKNMIYMCHIIQGKKMPLAQKHVVPSECRIQWTRKFSIDNWLL